MRTRLLIVFGVLFSAAAFAAEPTSTKPDPKLAEMLSAKDDKGKPIMTPEQQAYYDGLNDNLRELLNQAVKKKPSHVPSIWPRCSRCNCAHRRWNWCCKTTASFVTATRPTIPPTPSLLSPQLQAASPRT